MNDVLSDAEPDHHDAAHMRAKRWTKWFAPSFETWREQFSASLARMIRSETKAQLFEIATLTRELATLREQRDRLREALSRIATVDDLELPPRAVAMRAESIARTALAQTDEKGGV